jgi:Dolichyl-phosphate-mannose-protein mannosyltransferase
MPAQRRRSGFEVNSRLSSHNRLPPKLWNRFHGFRFRRRILRALGKRYRPGLKPKLIIASSLFLFSFSVKSLHAVDLAPTLHTNEQLHAGMAGEYLRDAQSILRGHGLLIPDNQDPSDTSLLVHAPGYPILLSGIYHLFGGSYFTVQVVQNLLASISVVMLFLIAGNLVSWPVGIVASFIAAVSHHFSYYSNVILPDSVCALPLLAAFYILIKARRARRGGLWLYVLAGILIGISIWLRPNVLLLGPVMVCFLVVSSKRPRRMLRQAWVLAVISVLSVVPITIRNYLLYGEFVLVSANIGIVMWEGIGEASGDRFGAVTNDVLVAQQEAQLYGDPRYAESWVMPDGIKRDRDRMSKSLSVIVNHPIWFAGSMLKRMAAMLKYSGDAPLVFRPGDRKVIEAAERLDREQVRNPSRTHTRLEIESDRRVVAIGERLSLLRLPVRAIQRAAKETMLATILIGVLAFFAAGWRRALFLSIVPIYYLMVQSTMHTEFRYTLPMHYFLFIFAAIAWVMMGSGLWQLAKQVAAPGRVNERS